MKHMDLVEHLIMNSHRVCSYDEMKLELREILGTKKFLNFDGNGINAAARKMVERKVAMERKVAANGTLHRGRGKSGLNSKVSVTYVARRGTRKMIAGIRTHHPVAAQGVVGSKTMESRKVVKAKMERFQGGNLMVLVISARRLVTRKQIVVHSKLLSSRQGIRWTITSVHGPMYQLWRNSSKL